MNIYKNKLFNKWAAKEGLSDGDLAWAVDEMERGLIDANLGSHIVKKRVAIGGRGKSGGVRTLLAYRIENKAFFIYGFAKNVRANIKDDELKSLKQYGKLLLSYDEKTLTQLIKSGALIEVKNDG